MCIRDRDSTNTISPLSTTDFKGITKDTKRVNRIKANSVDEKEFYVDPVSGNTFNPWIYRPNREVLDERLELVNKSELLNKAQKDFINNFQESLTDKLSTNQRAVATDNLRVVFERQLKPGTDNFGKPWENLTAVIRAENVNAVQNVSKRLNVTERRRSNSFIGVDIRDKEAKASVNILGTQRTFDSISKNLNACLLYTSPSPRD